MEPSTQPKEITRVADEKLRVVWDDGHESVFPFRLLRQSCPCASCRDEFTGRPLLDAESVPRDIKAAKAELVGNYAIAFQFSDGHATGIYSFENLRKLCRCPKCGAA